MLLLLAMFAAGLLAGFGACFLLLAMLAAGRSERD